VSGVLALPLRQRHRRSFPERSWRVVPSRLVSDQRNPRRRVSAARLCVRGSAGYRERNGRKWRSARRGERKGCSQEWLAATTTGGRALLTKSSRRSYLSASPLPPRRALPLPTLPHPPAAPSESIPAHPRSLSHVRTERTRASRSISILLPFRCFHPTLPSESPRETARGTPFPLPPSRSLITVPRRVHRALFGARTTRRRGVSGEISSDDCWTLTGG